MNKSIKSIIRFYLIFQIFFIVHRFTIKFFLDTIFNFFSKFYYIFLLIYHFFIKKDIYLVSSKSPLYAFIFWRNIHKDKFFSILVANKLFKTLLAKTNFIRYYYFINIFIFYSNRSFVLVKLLFFHFNICKFYNCFIKFYIQFIFLFQEDF